ncbi:MAG: hypothetical protein ACYC2G_01325 [Gemmatimonadaceae bacterium]
MKRKQALALQEAWGDRPCDHPELAREYDQGVRTGHYVCSSCGRTLTFREKAELDAARRPEQSGDPEAG